MAETVGERGRPRSIIRHSFAGWDAHRATVDGDFYGGVRVTMPAAVADPCGVAGVSRSWLERRAWVFWVEAPATCLRPPS
jgi:hypothetical protein